MAEKPASGPSDYLAAERTFLAWIRTGLALMGFGFVVARFGLFLEALQFRPSALQVNAYGPSFWFGTALIALGVIVNLMSAWNHFRLVQKLNSGAAGLQSSIAAGDERSRHPGGGRPRDGRLRRFGTAAESANAPKHPEVPMISSSDNGIVSISSQHPVEQTVEKIQQFLEAKGVKLFALVDHSGEAEKVGLHMRPTKLLIFGNPKAGTPLMIASPSIAIDLPLKILVWEEAAGKVWISYNSAAYLQARHGVPSELVPNIAVIENFAKAAAE